jgi:hypothetical protein
MRRAQRLQEEPARFPTGGRRWPRREAGSLKSILLAGRYGEIALLGDREQLQYRHGSPAGVRTQQLAVFDPDTAKLDRSLQHTAHGGCSEGGKPFGVTEMFGEPGLGRIEALVPGDPVLVIR